MYLTILVIIYYKCYNILLNDIKVYLHIKQNLKNSNNVNQLAKNIHKIVTLLKKGKILKIPKLSKKINKPFVF